MQRYDPGDSASLRREVTDPDGTLTDTSIVFEYRLPGSDIWTSSPVTHVSTGVYDTTVPSLVDGRYRYRWTASGAIDEVTTGYFYVADEADELPPLASFEMLARKLGGDPDDFDINERARAEYLLDEASEMIRDVAEKTWVSTAGALVDVPRRVARICVAAAARAFSNPEGLAQRTIGDSSKSYDRAGREGGEVVYLTAAEEEDIRRASGASGFQSVTLVSPYSDGTLLDPWAAVMAE